MHMINKINSRSKLNHTVYWMPCATENLKKINSHTLIITQVHSLNVYGMSFDIHRNLFLVLSLLNLIQLILESSPFKIITTLMKNYIEHTLILIIFKLWIHNVQIYDTVEIVPRLITVVIREKTLVIREI